LVREPVGVVATIIPWNVPALLTALKLAPTLLAGCTVIVKSTPEAPGAGYILAEIIEVAGLPPGVVNFVTADREASEALVRDPRVDKVSFTGSSAVGKRIAAICSERVGRYTLELGGKSAAVILDDYDVATAAESLSQATRVLTGQVCFSVSRVIVDRARHDDFVEALRNGSRSADRDAAGLFTGFLPAGVELGLRARAGSVRGPPDAAAGGRESDRRQFVDQWNVVYAGASRGLRQE
jgi:aldehyde dehydrogenase (NAD+)